MIPTSHPIRAALSAAAVSATALLSTLSPWGASAQQVADIKSQAVLEQQTSPFTKRQCAAILSTSELIFRNLRGTEAVANPELPLTLAGFIAPSKPTLVHDLLTKGNLTALVASKLPADIAKVNALKNAITCDGPKDIVVSGHGVAMFSQIRSTLLGLPEPISLQAAGVRGVLPPGVVGSLPADPKRLNLGGPTTKLGDQRPKLH